MDKATEVQIKKAIAGNVLSRNESAFILSLLNIIGSFKGVVEVMESYSTTRTTSDTVAKNFTLKQHMELSAIALYKIKRVKLDTNDIDLIR